MTAHPDSGANLHVPAIGLLLRLGTVSFCHAICWRNRRCATEQTSVALAKKLICPLNQPCLTNCRNRSAAMVKNERTKSQRSEGLGVEVEDAHSLQSHELLQQGLDVVRDLFWEHSFGDLLVIDPKLYRYRPRVLRDDLLAVGIGQCLRAI